MEVREASYYKSNLGMLEGPWIEREREREIQKEGYGA
jgi:hypothetical protein